MDGTHVGKAFIVETEVGTSLRASSCQLYPSHTRLIWSERT